ncbi:hypothetical protein [Methylobacterium oryzae]|uniref:hypothetical protein n=1 Tax=Methylobacterium oryzae TaxID=334852 RepID=UPI002F34FF2B
MLALHVAPANATHGDAMVASADAVQQATGDCVVLAYVDQAYVGDRESVSRSRHRPEVMKLPEAYRGFAPLPG